MGNTDQYDYVIEDCVFNQNQQIMNNHGYVYMFNFNNGKVT